MPREATERLRVVTLGCPIDEGTPTANYSQFLGLFDGLGLLNSWGNRPETTIPTHHSTNAQFPLSMPVSLLTRLAMAQEAPSQRAITHEPPRIEGPAPATRQRARTRREV